MKEFINHLLGFSVREDISILSYISLILMLIFLVRIAIDVANEEF